MRIAYILDSTSKFKNQDVYTVPFRAFDPKGNIVKVYDKEYINTLIDTKTDDSKLYIEPTPGMYRDLYLSLKKQGYDYIIVIPQSKEKSSSYKFAQYATRITSMDVSVVDVTEFSVSNEEIIQLLLTDTDTKKEIESITFDWKRLIQVLLNAFSNSKPVTV